MPMSIPSIADRPSGLSYPPRIVSGVQPSPKLHLGHYFGAMQNLIRLQHEYPGDTFYLIADQHALRGSGTHADLREEIFDLACTLLAVGLDPNKCILYRQSDLPECMELVWYLSCVTSGSLLRQGATQAQDEPPSASDLLYPVLMASDVLCLRGTIIATGHDQQANAETVRAIAQRFNRLFGREVFPVPQARFSGDHVVPGTDGAKMSTARGNYVGLFEPFYRLQEQVKGIVTDSKGLAEPKDPDACTVCRLFGLVASAGEREALAEAYRRGEIGYEEAKRRLVAALQEYFAEAESRYHDLRRQPYFVADVLHEGIEQAREEARYTLDLVRELFGVAA